MLEGRVPVLGRALGLELLIQSQGWVRVQIRASRRDGVEVEGKEVDIRTWPVPVVQCFPLSL